MTDLWQFRARPTGVNFEGPLEAVWEVMLDPMSDDYTPDEIDATELLVLWAEKVRKERPDGLIPIFWYVQSEGQGQFERMPFQFEHDPDLEQAEDFLTYLTWPTNSTTGERLNWLTLPVVDKLWNSKRSNKGGFIQEATGWKPSILQPHVFLEGLLRGAGVIG